VLIELFSLGVTAEALRAIIGTKSAISLQRGPVYPKFQVEGVAPTNHSSSQKTRLNDLSQGIKICKDFSFVLLQFTRLTDRQTEFSSLDRVCIPCSTVKKLDDRGGLGEAAQRLSLSVPRRLGHLKVDSAHFYRTSSALYASVYCKQNYLQMLSESRDRPK